jgi:mannose-6-phosphate isomerase-like protein (cupin superfamily)
MILKKNKDNLSQRENCHQGTGKFWCSELLADYQKKGAGFKLIHENLIEAGASIGEHTHQHDEEIYIILSGTGIMSIDGIDQEVSEGSVCLTRSGHSHSLQNSINGPMRFMVIATNL